MLVDIHLVYMLVSDCIFCIAQSVSCWIIGTSEDPVSVKAYSTRIGTSGNTVRVTKLSAYKV